MKKNLWLIVKLLLSNNPAATLVAFWIKAKPQRSRRKLLRSKMKTLIVNMAQVEVDIWHWKNVEIDWLEVDRRIILAMTMMI